MIEKEGLISLDEFVTGAAVRCETRDGSEERTGDRRKWGGGAEGGGVVNTRTPEAEGRPPNLG